MHCEVTIKSSKSKYKHSFYCRHPWCSDSEDDIRDEIRSLHSPKLFMSKGYIITYSQSTYRKCFTVSFSIPIS